MFTKSDKKWLRETFATKDDLKKELNPIKKQFSPMRYDLSKLKEITEFTKNAVLNILDWTEDIHKSIVLKKLPERVQKLEQIFKTS